MAFPDSLPMNGLPQIRKSKLIPMSKHDPWQSYRQVSAKTASPGQLILMLFDGGVRYLEQAQSGFQLEDPLEYNLTIHNNIQKAVAVINELNCCLNMEAGGQIAATLRRLYEYMERRLYEANQQKHEGIIVEGLNRLITFRVVWKERL